MKFVSKAKAQFSMEILDVQVKQLAERLMQRRCLVISVGVVEYFRYLPCGLSMTEGSFPLNVPLWVLEKRYGIKDLKVQYEMVIAPPGESVPGFTDLLEKKLLPLLNDYYILAEQSETQLVYKRKSGGYTKDEESLLDRFFGQREAGAEPYHG
jgi:hypothetical protein